LIKNILKYICRGWENEQGYHHPKLKILPPFFYDLLTYFIVISFAIGIIKYLFDL